MTFHLLLLSSQSFYFLWNIYVDPFFQYLININFKNMIIYAIVIYRSSSATIKKLEVTLTEHMLPTLKFILGWRSVKNIEKGQGRPNIPNNRHVTWTINPFGIGMVDCSCGNLTSWLLFRPWDCTSRMWPYQLWEIFSAETSSLIEFFVVRWISRSMVEVRVSSFQWIRISAIRVAFARRHVSTELFLSISCSGPWLIWTNVDDDSFFDNCLCSLVSVGKLTLSCRIVLDLPHTSRNRIKLDQRYETWLLMKQWKTEVWNRTRLVFFHDIRP